ncbi:MAG: tetratricopeptide repeat protein [Treponema sp.]|nr:tetratricopeptide repeat protein [Candidatus Treponema merdequi]
MAGKNVEKMPKKENLTSVDKVSNFVSANRVVLLSTICVVILGLVGYTIFLHFSQMNVEKDLAQIENIEFLFTKDAAGASEDVLKDKYDSALKNLEKYTSKGGIAGARASYLSAEIKFLQKDYSAAKDFYIAAASKVNKTYLSSICCYCAGVCFEELNDTDKALEYYENSANDKNFPDTTHALFNAGRIKESKLDYTGAKEAYEKITAKNNPNDPWSNAAQSRILQMQIDGKIE